MTQSRRNFLKSLFVAPAIVAVGNIMPVKALELILPEPIWGVRTIPYGLRPEYDIEKIIQSYLFEVNDSTTHAQIREHLTRQAHQWDVQQYKVICDETNNPPNAIDKNELRVDVYMQPKRSIEYIQINAISHREGVTFQEIIRA